ncbi:DDE superfamily endonuclease containing protein [Trichomonas vaginalis G3]|uniref:DDE superfamily endonuclease containing protein n=1 Tax=Trichomonas vaginalis (strain ATCC PRA-98 / G3) TaxID=412133 RepID=A2DJS6_TRIV3|nr:transposon family [Trichomonas vaginalis G3]EAY19290.1 DDE superfamily endonuclease containing protein [Trichomonas vaginalis G3]KAI5527192.1 transposon family [Trichomonas vaginalis G3]|eukprot:XP_001580276.1 DDE superfamily endonuclease containing protein [Trichomonas vaginalis G3]
MGLVLRGFHQPRESEGTNLEEEINDFELTKRQLLEKHRNDQFISRLINMDESKWYEHPIFGLTFGFKGVKNVVFKTYNEKACITIVATITSNGEQRLPLMILLKDSEECKTFAEKFPNIYFVESNKGWTTETGMIKYIKFIVDFYKKNYFSHNQAYFREKENQHIDLIVDKYLSHIGGQKLKQCLVKNNVSIYFVPSDATGRCQPLDVRVFGALKGSASKLYWQEFIFNRNFQLNRTNSIRILEKAWDQLDKKTIADGWKEYERIMKFNNTDNSKIYAQINKLHGDVYERIMNINDQLILKKNEFEII